MARILSESFTVPADPTGATPVYSSWATVGSATSIDAAVTVANDNAPDIWIQWTDDPSGPEPEDVDVFAVGFDPHGNHYHVYANGLAPAGAYIRVKAIAWELDANCHATIDTN